MKYCVLMFVFDQPNNQVFEQVISTHPEYDPQWAVDRVLFIPDANNLYNVGDEVAGSRHDVPAISVMQDMAVKDIISWASSLTMAAQVKSGGAYASVRDAINLASDEFANWVRSDGITHLDLYGFDPETFATRAGIVWPSV